MNPELDITFTNTGRFTTSFTLKGWFDAGSKHWINLNLLTYSSNVHQTVFQLFTAMALYDGKYYL